jgi:hypothetical protein
VVSKEVGIRLGGRLVHIYSYCTPGRSQTTPPGLPPGLPLREMESTLSLAIRAESELWVKPMIGRTIAHYELGEKLGEGGMGVVYRARDTRLNRDVAIKVLADSFAGNRDRKARFEREARLLATLNHPNIAAIYGIEETEGGVCLILELVKGQTLAERLRRGRIPLDETIGLCQQIADGLEAAHERGIIHRDLKPANVKIAPDGRVKILDFGLAKAFSDTAPPIGSESPTQTSDSTPGIIIGTAAYMSPEQAKGRPVDKRTDVWALGCILYECLAGRRAFVGDTVTETLAAVIKSEPDWSALPENTPANVRFVLRQCLHKESSLRLHDIADATLELKEQATETISEVPVYSRRSWLVGTVAGISGALAGAGLMARYRPASLPGAVARSVIRLEPGLCLDGMRWFRGFMRPTRTAMALAHHGLFLVYSAVGENAPADAKGQLYLRRMDQLQAKPIPGTEGGINPFLSPDDRWVGFWADGKLMKVSVDGGVPLAICDSTFPFGVAWGPDGRIVFAPQEGGGLSLVSSDGGKPEILTVPDKAKNEFGHRLPHYSPDGKSLLVTVFREPWDLEPRVVVAQLNPLRWHYLLEGAADAHYLPTGHLVFLRRGTLMAVCFDLRKQELKGQPVPVIGGAMQALNNLDSTFNTAAGQFGVSDSGHLVYTTGGITHDLENSLVWVNQDGTVQPAIPFKAPFFGPRLSPDGRRIAYTTRGKEHRVWEYDITRVTATPLSADGKVQSVAWTPDGRRLTFDWYDSVFSKNLYWQPIDGTASKERLTTSEHPHYTGSWSPDGNIFAFVQQPLQDAGSDILLLSRRERSVTTLLHSQAQVAYPEFSPNGHWLAFGSNESGREEIYVRPFPGPGGTWKISREGGIDPLWARDGRRLFYRWRGQVWAVDIGQGNGFEAGKPRLLFDQPGFLYATPARTWDISLDGKRFLMVKLDEGRPTPVTELVFVQNWFEELKRLVPTGRK